MGGRPLGERDRFPFFDEFGGSHDPAIAGNSDRKNSLVGTPPIPPQTRPVDTLCIQQRGEIAVIESSPPLRSKAQACPPAFSFAFFPCSRLVVEEHSSASGGQPKCEFWESWHLASRWLAVRSNALKLRRMRALKWSACQRSKF